MASNRSDHKTKKTEKEKNTMAINNIGKQKRNKRKERNICTYTQRQAPSADNECKKIKCVHVIRSES